MNKNVSDVFKEKEKVNIGYIVAGYPGIDFTKEFLLNLDKNFNRYSGNRNSLF